MTSAMVFQILATEGAARVQSLHPNISSRCLPPVFGAYFAFELRKSGAKPQCNLRPVGLAFLGLLCFILGQVGGSPRRG
jgi:hypothetical protein